MSTINLKVDITIPYLWGTDHFQKNTWGGLNVLIGPNGSGKSLFAEQLKVQCSRQGLHARSLSAERLRGLEKRDYGQYGNANLQHGFELHQLETYKKQAEQLDLASSALVLLREKIDIRIRVEATLQQMFGRRLSQSDAEGFLKTSVTRTGSKSYDFRANECHGLKELIALLTFLYDDGNNCLLLDEPELHLHPQYQQFLLQQLRNMAGDPRIDRTKKLLFVITHSPYFVDLRTPDDFSSCVFFHPDRMPTCVESLDEADSHPLRRLLPRLNTHHKQFFFAPRPLFVEGYTDQHFYSLLQQYRGVLSVAASSCIIDVGGKEELDLFVRLCHKLGIDAQVIVDLDAILKGRLRQTVSENSRYCNFMQTHGIDASSPMKPIGELEHALTKLATAIAKVELPETLRKYFPLHSVAGSVSLEKSRYMTLVAVVNEPTEFLMLLPHVAGDIEFITGRLNKICGGFAECGVHVLGRGQLENYFLTYRGSPTSVTDKADAFHAERERLLSGNLSREDVDKDYGEITKLLDASMKSVRIDFDAVVTNFVQDWAYRVQAAVKRNKITKRSELAEDASLDWNAANRILGGLEFESFPDGGFKCRVILNHRVDPEERYCEFTHGTRPLDITLVRASSPVPSAPKSVATAL